MDLRPMPAHRLAKTLYGLTYGRMGVTGRTCSDEDNGERRCSFLNKFMVIKNRSNDTEGSKSGTRVGRRDACRLFAKPEYRCAGRIFSRLVILHYRRSPLDDLVARGHSAAGPRGLSGLSGSVLSSAGRHSCAGRLATRIPPVTYVSANTSLSA